MFGVSKAPYANGLMPGGGGDFRTVLHLGNVGNVKHTDFAAGDLLQHLRQRSIGARFAVFVLTKCACVNWNRILLTRQFLERFRRGGDANNQSVRMFCYLTQGVACETGEVRLRAKCWEYGYVVCFVAHNDIEERFQFWIMPHPYPKLRIGSCYNFGWVAVRERKCRVFDAVFIEHIGHCKRFFVCQTNIAVVGINEKKGFARA